MDANSYPGQGLSLLQLVFALNKELKRAAYCSSFPFDAVSQLDHDTSTALANIREWKNSFVPINRIPSDVFSLIPTHLPYEKDLFHASSVCRHWRRTFVQHAALWSQLDLTNKRGDLVKTLLERAKGSALDIRSIRLDRADVLALLSPRARQFRSLNLIRDCWSDIGRFSEAVPGPLPLLHTLNIDVAEPEVLDPETTDPSSLPLFSGAVNLRTLVLHLEGVLPSNYFVFPNLTTFELSITPEEDGLHALELLNFLETSSTLRTVRLRIDAETSLEDVPPGRTIVLPNVEVFSVTRIEPDHGIAAHISCPSANLTSLVHEDNVRDGLWDEVFPTSISWDPMGPQYTTSPIDEVILSMQVGGDVIVSCSLSFLSSGPATLELGYRVTEAFGLWIGDLASLGEKHSQVFSRALGAVRMHPLLSNIKRLSIRDRHIPLDLDPYQHARVTNQVVRLFKSVSSLEELVLDVDDLRLLLPTFFGLPEFRGPIPPYVFPSIKGLTIVDRSEELDEEWVAAIVAFAESQLVRGMPLERVVLRIRDSPEGIVERLRPRVGTVDLERIAGGEQD